MFRPRRRFIALLGLLLMMAPLAPAHARSETGAGRDIGVVVLHGKQGQPADRNVGPLVQALRNAGYAVQAPGMCWSRTRIYDKPYPDCLRDIDAAIATLRAGGARRIVVAGMSLGGNAAIAYAAQHPELAGLVALAPASQPAQMMHDPAVAQSLQGAQQMVASGHGDDHASFTDTNNGSNFSVATTAAIFVSFIAPGGPADFPQLLGHIHVPMIWVAGTQDRSQAQAAALFARVPANPLNRLVPVDSEHLGTPAAGSDAVLAWLRTLPVQ